MSTQETLCIIPWTILNLNIVQTYGHPTHATKHRRLLENIQRRATKVILNYPGKSYTDRLLELKMLPLRYRRETSDLLLFFKITSGLLDFNTNKYFSQVTISHNTRNSQTITVRFLNTDRIISCFQLPPEQSPHAGNNLRWDFTFVLNEAVKLRCEALPCVVGNPSGTLFL